MQQRSDLPRPALLSPGGSSNAPPGTPPWAEKFRAVNHPARAGAATDENALAVASSSSASSSRGFAAAKALACTTVGSSSTADAVVSLREVVLPNDNMAAKPASAEPTPGLGDEQQQLPAETGGSRKAALGAPLGGARRRERVATPTPPTPQRNVTPCLPPTSDGAPGEATGHRARDGDAGQDSSEQKSSAAMRSPSHSVSFASSDVSPSPQRRLLVADEDAGNDDSTAAPPTASASGDTDLEESDERRPSTPRPRATAPRLPHPSVVPRRLPQGVETRRRATTHGTTMFVPTFRRAASLTTAFRPLAYHGASVTGRPQHQEQQSMTPGIAAGSEPPMSANEIAAAGVASYNRLRFETATLLLNGVRRMHTTALGGRGEVLSALAVAVADAAHAKNELDTVNDARRSEEARFNTELASMERRCRRDVLDCQITSLVDSEDSTRAVLVDAAFEQLDTYHDAFQHALAVQRRCESERDAWLLQLLESDQRRAIIAADHDTEVLAAAAESINAMAASIGQRRPVTATASSQTERQMSLGEILRGTSRRGGVTSTAAADDDDDGPRPAPLMSSSCRRCAGLEAAKARAEEQCLRRERELLGTLVKREADCELMRGRVQTLEKRVLQLAACPAPPDPIDAATKQLPTPTARPVLPPTPAADAPAATSVVSSSTGMQTDPAAFTPNAAVEPTSSLNHQAAPAEDAKILRHELERALREAEALKRTRDALTIALRKAIGTTAGEGSETDDDDANEDAGATRRRDGPTEVAPSRTTTRPKLGSGEHRRPGVANYQERPRVTFMLNESN